MQLPEQTTEDILTSRYFGTADVMGVDVLGVDVMTLFPYYGYKILTYLKHSVSLFFTQCNTIVISGGVMLPVLPYYPDMQLLFYITINPQPSRNQIRSDKVKVEFQK